MAYNTNIVVVGYPIFYKNGGRIILSIYVTFVALMVSIMKNNLKVLSILLLIKWNIIVLFQLYQIDGVKL